MISSDLPWLYTSAVLMNVPPAAAKRSSCSCAPGSSVSVPNVIVPRQKLDTAQPLRPRVRYSIQPTLCGDARAGRPRYARLVLAQSAGLEGQQMAKGTRIGSAVMFVQQLDRSVSFYQDVLALQVADQTPPPRCWSARKVRS